MLFVVRQGDMGWLSMVPFHYRVDLLNSDF